MAWCYSSSTGLTVFTYLVALTVVTVALPYLFSALAQLSYLVSRQRRCTGRCSPVICPSPGRGIVLAVDHLRLRLPGRLPGYGAHRLMAYPFLKARRERLGEAAEPHDLPAGDGAAALPRPGTLLSPGSGTNRRASSASSRE
jgi:basic amino acid/polyamine antiporter, APA family